MKVPVGVRCVCLLCMICCMSMNEIANLSYKSDVIRCSLDVSPGEEFKTIACEHTLYSHVSQEVIC